MSEDFIYTASVKFQLKPGQVELEVPSEAKLVTIRMASRFSAEAILFCRDSKKHLPFEPLKLLLLYSGVKQSIPDELVTAESWFLVRDSYNPATDLVAIRIHGDRK